MTNLRKSIVAGLGLLAWTGIAFAQEGQSAGTNPAQNESLVSGLKQQVLADMQSMVDLRISLANLQTQIGNLQATIQKLQGASTTPASTTPASTTPPPAPAPAAESAPAPEPMKLPYSHGKVPSMVPASPAESK